jgi:drug/metabolite transporter (DMT)-like permease
MTRTYFELLFTTLLWGFGFIASIWTLEAIGPVLSTALRFGLALVFLLLYALAKKQLKFSLREFKILFGPGFCIFAMISLQTWGMQTTSAGRSSFITVLYVLFVPILERVLYRVRVKPILYLWVGVALLGTLFICGAITRAGLSPDFFQSIRMGDLLTLGCAFFAAGHIVLVNQTMNQIDSELRYHIYQCAWVTLIALIATALTEGFHQLFVPWTAHVWFGLLHLGLFSSAVAFLIQVRAQKVIPPTQIGLIILLESPWALCISLLLGMEVVTNFQLLGAGMIFVAAGFESLSAFDFRSAIAKARFKSK